MSGRRSSRSRGSRGPSVASLRTILGGIAVSRAVRRGAITVVVLTVVAVALTGASGALQPASGSSAGSGTGAPGEPRAPVELRTLEEIPIEGEVVMPQVLFITAREPYRYADSAHHRYLADPEEVRTRSALRPALWIGRPLVPVPWGIGPLDAGSPVPPEVRPSPFPPDPGAAATGREAVPKGGTP